jgi:antagonist of KipI
MLTTVQDAGRWGWQSHGVPVAGPMDPRAHRLANLLVGNPETCATLEITLIGPELQFGADTTVAVTGADCEVTVNGTAVPMNETVFMDLGSILRIGTRRRGARAYLGVGGGIDVPPVFGSRATHLPSRMGGLGGRALAAGDRLPIGVAAGKRARRRAAPVSLPDGGARVRVMPGPHDMWFARQAIDALDNSRYTVTPQSDRMGYRLDGPALTRRGIGDIISDATAPGSVQVPASGSPILLMADRQTSGGYPKIATVITADIGLAGQLVPGDWIEFRICDRAQAIQALRDEERRLSMLS